MPHNTLLDFQDSEVSSAELIDTQLVVRFSAAYVRHTNDSVDNQSYIQALELVIHHPTIIEKDSGCVGRLSNGSLRIAEVMIKLVPIPYEANANVELELAFANGSICKVLGKRVALKATSDVRVIEWLKC